MTSNIGCCYRMPVRILHHSCETDMHRFCTNKYVLIISSAPFSMYIWFKIIRSGSLPRYLYVCMYVSRLNMNLTNFIVKWLVMYVWIYCYSIVANLRSSVRSFWFKGACIRNVYSLSYFDSAMHQNNDNRGLLSLAIHRAVLLVVGLLNASMFDFNFAFWFIGFGSVRFCSDYVNVYFIVGFFSPSYFK